MEFPRLFVQDLDRIKATHALQRISHRANAHPGLIYAVLYHADRAHAALTGRTIYGETYLAYHHAPVPSWAHHVYMTLTLPTRDVPLYLEQRQLFLINLQGLLINRDMTQTGDAGLDELERRCLDDALHWYRNASREDILRYRRDAGWCETAQGEPIPLALLTRRGAQDDAEPLPPAKPLDFVQIRQSESARPETSEEATFSRASALSF